jgi:hypothetical protein
VWGYQGGGSEFASYEDVTPWSVVCMDWCLGKKVCVNSQLHIHLMIKVAALYKISIRMYQTTRRHIAANRNVLLLLNVFDRTASVCEAHAMGTPLKPYGLVAL